MSDKLAVVGSFAALAVPADDQFGLQDIVNINMGGSGVDPSMLDKIKVPSGGSLSWEVPGIDGEPEPRKELVGVFVGLQNIRSFYATKYEGGNEPPNCSSRDGVNGDPDDVAQERGATGNCNTCPLARFGPDNERPLCSGRRLALFLPPDSMLPLVINVPPTSMRELDKYLIRLTSKKLPFFKAVTSLKLVKEKNSGGIEYARIAPSFVRVLEPEEAQSAFAMFKSLSQVFSQVAKNAATEGF